MPRDENGKLDYRHVVFKARTFASQQDLTAYNEWMAEHRDEVCALSEELRSLDG